MRRRIATLYPWVVGILGLAYLTGRLIASRHVAGELLRGEFLALLAMFGVLELNRIPIRGGLAVGFGTVAVVIAVILGGHLPAMAMSLGGLASLIRGGRFARVSVFNAGAYVLSAAAGSLAASLAGYPVSGPAAGLNIKGPLVFTVAYFLVTTLIVGVYSIAGSRGGKAADHLYNLGFYGVLVVISTSLGISVALAYRNFGAVSLYLMCVTLSMLSFLLSLGTRVASNREGLFGLYQAASSINEALTLKEVFERAHAFTHTLLHQDFAWLSLPSGEEGDNLTVAYTSSSGGVDLERATAHAMSLGRGDEATRPGDQFVWTRDQSGDSQGYFGWATVTALHLGKQFLGEFGVASLSMPPEVSPDKLQLLAVLSSHLALAVDNALKFESATMLAFTDPLTGLYNYRQFQNLFREAIARAEKTSTPVSLIYIDLDYFRDVNNRYGHQVGDEALKDIAKVIRASCRDKDLVCRPGGDEFTVILPGVPQDNARVVAERVRENLTSMRLEVGLPEPLVSAIGASVGVSTYPEDGSEVDILVKKADADMYASKTEGGRGAGGTG